MATAAASGRLELVDWIDETDLRTVISRSNYLWDVQKEYKLRPGQGVIFANKLLDRARMVVMLGTMPVLLVLPTAETRALRTSLFLEVSRYLRNGFHMQAKAVKVQEAVVEKVEKRYERQLKLAGTEATE